MLTSVTIILITTLIIEPHHEKTNNVVSEQVRHNPKCTNTEDILDNKIDSTIHEAKTKALISSHYI